MRRVLGAGIAAAILCTAAPAAAENWQEFQAAEPGARMWVDLDTIRVIDGITHFRVRMTLPDLEGHAIGNNTADCAAGIGMTHDMSLYDGNGEFQFREEYNPPDEVEFADEDAGLLAIICPSEG